MDGTCQYSTAVLQWVYVVGEGATEGITSPWADDLPRVRFYFLFGHQSHNIKYKELCLRI